MDGSPRLVPSRVGSWESLRAALGVAEGAGVAVKALVPAKEAVDPHSVSDYVEGWVVLGFDENNIPGAVPRVWDFSPGEEYVLRS